jgi:hypothetical protein
MSGEFRDVPANFTTLARSIRLVLIVQLRNSERTTKESWETTMLVRSSRVATVVPTAKISAAVATPSRPPGRLVARVPKLTTNRPKGTRGRPNIRRVLGERRYEVVLEQANRTGRSGEIGSAITLAKSSAQRTQEPADCR